MDFASLQQYIDEVIADLSVLNDSSSMIHGDKHAEQLFASLSNFLGNVRQYVHELNTAMNGGDQFLMVKAANKDIEHALDALGQLWQGQYVQEQHYRMMQEKLSNLGLLVRSAIDPDYIQSWE